MPARLKLDKLTHWTLNATVEPRREIVFFGTLKSFIICIFSTSNATLLEWDGVLNAKQPLKALKLKLC